MVSATSWFVFFSLIVAFNITNAQVPYGALAGVGAALESLGPVGAILALESGLPLGGLGLGVGSSPFSAGIPFPGNYPGGFPGQGYPGGYPGPFDGVNYPTPIPSKGLDNGFYGGYPGQFPNGFVDGQPTYFNIPVQETQVTESVTVSETTSIPNGYYDASNQGFPLGGGFAGNPYESALAPEPTFLNGYNNGYFGPYPGQGFPGGNGGITQVVPVPVPEPIYVPEPILVPEPYAVPVPVPAGPSSFPGPLQSGYPSFNGNYGGYSQPGFSGAFSSGFSGFPSSAPTSYPVGPSFPASLPPVYPSPLPSYPRPSQPGPVGPQFPGEYCGDYSVGFPAPPPPAFPGPRPGCYPPGPITVIEECDGGDNSFSKLLPLILILSLSGGGGFC